MDRKTTSIVAYLTWIGLLIAYLVGDREGAKFHLNQALVLVLAGIVLGIVAAIPVIGWIVTIVGDIFLFVCWIIGLVGAINDEENPVPVLGSIQLLK
ncbi:MAG: hypothetical protein K6G07_04525 [Lachnospiraceae bacterium]|nr:hypothetical protein [Lachnospiraceae bacterium]